MNKRNSFGATGDRFFFFSVLFLILRLTGAVVMQTLVLVNHVQ